MYKQLAALFARYTAAHLKAQGKPQALTGSDGRVIGALDVITLDKGHIRLAGWSRADEIVLHMNGIKASVQPGLRRDDVAQAYGFDAHLGFDITVPLGPLKLTEIARFGLEFHSVGPDQPTIAMTLPLDHLHLVRLQVLYAFLVAIFTQIPPGIGWLATSNPKYRGRIKQGLQLTALPQSRELDPDLFRIPDKLPQLRPDSRITIIMPVFNAFELLQDALERVKNHTELPWRLILIEDASTDIRVRPFLRSWENGHSDQVILIENKENLGFIRSVNKGFEKALLWYDPVVLLNSDAFVPVNWAARLIGPLFARKNVATVTPMSNDAEIFSAPLICHPQELTTGQGDLIDKTAASLNPTAEQIAMPTGVGFCMAMNLAYLWKVPNFDTAFGRGYGEEVDWCQRVRDLGGLHLSANNLFVEHRGGQSFGNEEKQRLIAENNKKIRQRYPDFDRDVQHFVQSDPLRSTRLALALAWVGAQDNYPVSIYLAHSMGGGADAYLAKRIATKHHTLDRSAVVLRVGGKQRWQIELVTPDGTISGNTNSLDYVLQMLAPISRRRIVYSCGVGDHDPIDLPGALFKLSNNGRHTIEVLFHDYFPISPSYTLLDDTGIYHGVPPALNTDGVKPAGSLPSQTLKDWQNAWSMILETAKDIIVFSPSSAEIVKSVYPGISEKISIRPHRLLQDVPIIPARPVGSRRVVAILGDIGLQKGAGIIKDLARNFEKNDIGLVIIGNFDNSFPIPPSVPVHGSYRIENLTHICARYGVTDWLIPSIWPETFSFTTHEALATGLPVHAFDLGAQGAAVRQAKNGFPIEFSQGGLQHKNLIEHFHRYLHPHRNAA
ncbi:glycosyltransferase [Sulfitobacter sp. HGT1]|uniref:glycosyltransferase n=1 Tax=Sulfitobacter sp. HGT1 TaxID=2735435 RepID=UPI001592D569|nr:glycosyltransferase [Sulfitobacter sp. HGT1]